jgi:hypothetical protein
MRKAVLIVAVGALACAALTGCSGSDSEPEVNSSPSTTAAESLVETPSAPATPTATPAQAAVRDAAALADALRAQIPEITGVTVYDETNDPNDLIGARTSTHRPQPWQIRGPAVATGSTRALSSRCSRLLRTRRRGRTTSRTPSSHWDRPSARSGTTWMERPCCG